MDQSSASSVPMPKTGCVSVADPLDGEDGDDEKEEGERKPRKSFLEDEGLQRAQEEQQDRLGQWNTPRPRRRSIKEYSSSASARSGGQFDSFYSSWFSKKAQEETDEDLNVPAQLENKSEDTSEVEKELPDCDGEGGNANETELAKSTAEEKAPEEKKEACEVVANNPPANGGIFSSIFARKPKPELGLISNQTQEQPESGPDSQGNILTEEMEVSKTVESKTPLVTAPAQSTGILSTLFSKKPTDAAVLAKDEAKQVEATAPCSEECDGDKATVARAAPVGIFASIFTKKTQNSAEATTQTADGTNESVSSLDLTEEGSTDDLDAEDADGEESDSKEALPSDNDPADGTDASVSSLEPSERGSTVDLEAEEADGEDTDSNGGLFSDEEGVACEPEPSPAKVPTEKPASFVSWFSRKPELESAEKTDNAESTTNDSRSTEDASGSLVPGVEGERVSQDESLPQQRQRDLSVSLDFADPTAWKERFDLEDGLTDDEPDVDGNDADTVEEDGKEVDSASEEDEKPMIVFRERWSEKEERIRHESPFGDHPGWRLLSVIVKSNDDLRQEQFAAQLIAQCDRIFREYSLPLSLRPYNVIATSAKTGLIEAVPDTVSLDSLKRNDPGYTTLLDFYTRLHGDKETTGFSRAQRNFVESLAAYSIVCYVFQIKDRHNGNILVDTDGHVIHIDFGFLLTNSPGSNWNFERAPFKLTDEFVELMGGPRSSTFRYFRSLCIRAYLALRRNMDQIVLLVEMMLVGNADLPCFAGGKKAVIEGLRSRLKPGARTSTCQVFVNQLIDQSINNWRTRWYDKYQRACLGIL
eukprot:jgi/Phyca11/508642/fgenesh2_kg.PHYCAscaffold_37_\